MQINQKAVSTFIMIILMLCSVILGALISYLWVMSSYYSMPENTTLLVVINVVFSASDATHFNVTILNPSNSVSDMNITAIRLGVEGKNETYDITTTDPDLGTSPMKIGTEQTFKCIKNWSNIAGETVRIEAVAANASRISYICSVPNVKLKLKPTFDVSQSIEHFNLTIESFAEDNISLTLSEIILFGMSINENVTPSLPYTLPPNQSETFLCNYNWENLRGENVTITVKTAEGYESAFITNGLLGAALYIDEVRFDYTDTSYFNLTINSSEYSTANATLNRVNLTSQDETTITLNTTPPLDITPTPISPNQSLNIKCFWSWSDHRNETIRVSVHTKQGFTPPIKTVETPPEIVWNITDVEFDLDYTGYFLVNVTNMPCSLREINVTKILLEGNETFMDPPFEVLTNGTQVMFNCSFPWGHLIGKNVNVTVLARGLEDWLNSTITIPPVALRLLDKPAISEVPVPDLNITIPYINITVLNSNNSLQNVTITKIVFETENGTFEVNGALTYPRLAPEGYILRIGENVTIICPWNWVLYLGPRLKVTIHTAEGFQVSETWDVPFPP